MDLLTDLTHPERTLCTSDPQNRAHNFIHQLQNAVENEANVNFNL